MSCPMRADAPAAGASRLCLRTVGRHAAQLADGRTALVIARFDRSAYVRDDEGRLACIGGEGLGLGPLNALTTAAEFAHARLAIGDRVALDAGNATVWRPREIDAPARAGVSAARAALAAAMSAVTPRGLAMAASGDPLGARARRGLAALAAWIAANDRALSDEIAALIGLGPGLTPAGDDALGGAMIALRAFGRPPAADRLARAVLPLARERTSDISLAHLQAAAEGEGAAALHDTLAAIAVDDRAATIDGLQRLDRIGHSSGWDALAGAATALQALT